jgi:hypothetical protein
MLFSWGERLYLRTHLKGIQKPVTPQTRSRLGPEVGEFQHIFDHQIVLKVLG